jgi:hypothetical protein
MNERWVIKDPRDKLDTLGVWGIESGTFDSPDDTKAA